MRITATSRTGGRGRGRMRRGIIPSMEGRRKLIIAGTALGAAVAGVAMWVAAPLPAGLRDPGPVPSITLQDRNGQVLRTTRSSEGSRGGWIPLAELDPKILQAFLAVEDHRFYAHHGVDVRGLARAVRDNVRAGHVVSGGSTLTMQLARLLRGTPRTLPGKLGQMLWAWRLDAHLDKAAILEQYLNRVPLGQGTAGVAAAAALYFGADAREVSLGQAALLAALAHAPSRDNPFVAPERARSRRAVALSRMVDLGYATPGDAGRAAQEPLLAATRPGPFLAPHFTTRVLQWAEDSAATPVGEWRTTLDLGLQTELEAETRHTVDVLKDRLVAHAAVVVLDNQRGDILAWVGSPDFFADTAGQVDMVVSPRQPGSALKPFLYGLAFDRGVTAATVLPDLPKTYQTTLGPYRPKNYDRRFHGPVRAREALGSSYNVPAVELADRIGVASLLRTLRAAGFATLTHGAEYYGLGLSLGNGDVTLLELANGYRGIANGGVWRPVRWRSDSQTVRLSDRRFMSLQAAALVIDILSDPVARIPSFGVETPLDFPFRAAAKTGTSRHFTDNWAVATTATFTVAVWVGNFNGRPMQGVGGITGAGPLLHRAVLLTARRYPPGDLPEPAPAGLVAARVCRLSGLLATPDCPALDEWFLPGTAPTRTCDWHQGGRIAWPAEYIEWATSVGQSDGRTVGLSAPTGQTVRLSDRPTLPTPAPFRILSPQDGDRYTLPVGVDPRYATLALRAAGGPGSGASVRWFVDGRPVAGERWTLAPGRHAIRAETVRGERDEVRIDVR
ncbi:MAG: penicillin-binding protein 1C [Gemmatimonadetes bacterium]|nr:MAG: penicillin-binding protein 1C [Gemmatimonadota bacterium]